MTTWTVKQLANLRSVQNALTKWGLRPVRTYTVLRLGSIGVGILVLSGLMAGGLVLSGCKRQQMPKPYAYARIDYPKAPYKTFNLPGHPCRFEYPGYFFVIEKPSAKSHTRWVDLRWPAYGVTLFTTYQQMEKPISAKVQAERMAGLLQEKLPTQTSIDAALVALSDSTLKAYVFEVNGSSSTPMEFLITDEKRNLFQGIVQFDQLPNRDSLADILNGLSDDMHRLILSFTFTPRP